MIWYDMIWYDYDMMWYVIWYDTCPFDKCLLVYKTVRRE
jgi:hypothetical protein